MHTLLTNLVIDRVDLVDEGANSEAFIQLYKRKENTSNMNFTDIISKMNADEAKIVQAELDRLNDELSKSTTSNETLTKQVGELTVNLEKSNNQVNALNEQITKVKDTSEDEILKSLSEPAKEIFKKMKLQKETAEEEVRKAAEAQVNAEAVAKASSLKALPVEQSELVNVIKKADKDVISMLEAVNKAIEDNVLVEKGASGDLNTTVLTKNEAWSKIEKRATAISAAEQITFEKAIQKVIETEKELYKQYVSGGAN